VAPISAALHTTANHDAARLSFLMTPDELDKILNFVL
jgi:hypothetical protein